MNNVSNPLIPGIGRYGTPPVIVTDTPRSNPLAPQWMGPQWGGEFCEQDYTYAWTFTIPTTGLFSQVLQFDVDNEFHCVDVAVKGLAQSTINTGVFVRLVDEWGKRRTNDFIPVGDFNGFLTREWSVLPGGSQRVDFRNTTGGQVVVYLRMRGYKRFQFVGCNSAPSWARVVPYIPLWARYSAPPPGYVDEPYVYEFPAWSITAPFVAQQEGVPFILDNDGSFILRTAGIYAVNSDATTTVAARLIDPWGNRLAVNVNTQTNGNPYCLVDGNFGNAALVSTGMRSLYPEVVCPAGGQLGLDINADVTAGTSTGTLRLQGVKRFPLGASSGKGRR